VQGENLNGVNGTGAESDDNRRSGDGEGDHGDEDDIDPS